MIEARYVLRTDEATDAAREAYRRSWIMRLSRSGSVIVGLGLIGIAFTGNPSPAYWVIAVGIWFVWHGIQSPVRRFSYKVGLKTSISNEEVLVQINETMVVVASPTTRIEAQWAAFNLAFETPKTFVLHDGKLLYVFPKRAFSEQCREELRRLIEEKISSQGLKAGASQ